MSFFRRLTVPAFLLFFSLVGCRSSPPTETMELRLYDVPKGSAGSILNMFNNIMWVGENAPRVARGAVTPDGKLAVLTTPSVHVGVAQLVEEVTKHPPPSDQAVELHYFLVVAKPASSPQPYPPNTAEIKSALDEIVKAQGPQTFTLGSRAGLASLNDEDGKIDNFDMGAKLEIHQHPVQTADGVYAKISIRWKDDQIQTRMRLGGDRVVVLGATGQRGADAGEPSTLYYVVRVAPRADGKSP